MGDNVHVNPGGANNKVLVATDEIVTGDQAVHWPMYKIAYGALGATTVVDESNPLPVADQNATYTQDGAQKVTVVDEGGSANIIGVYGEQLATDIKNDVLVQFQYGISTYDVTTDEVDTGTVTAADHMAVLSSGSGVNAAAHVSSVNSLRYRPGHTALGHFTCMWPNGPIANVEQFAGIFDDEDGLYVGYNGTDQVVGYMNDGVSTEAKSADWNGDPRISIVDFTKLNVFRFKFGWLGAVPIKFQMMLPGTEEWVDIHTFKVHGVVTEPHLGNPAMPVQMHIKKTAADATDVIMKTGSWQAGVFGLCQTCGNRPFSSAQVELAVGATPVMIASYRSVPTFQTKTNKVTTKLLRYQIHVDTPATGTGTIRVRFLGNPTYTGTPNYTAVDANNSTIEVDEDQAYDSGGVLALTEWVNYSANNKGGTITGFVTDAAQLGLFLRPGSNFAIVGDVVDGLGTPNVRVTFNWEELF